MPSSSFNSISYSSPFYLISVLPLSHLFHPLPPSPLRVPFPLPHFLFSSFLSFHRLPPIPFYFPPFLASFLSSSSLTFPSSSSSYILYFASFTSFFNTLPNLYHPLPPNLLQFFFIFLPLVLVFPLPASLDFHYFFSFSFSSFSFSPTSSSSLHTPLPTIPFSFLVS